MKKIMELIKVKKNKEELEPFMIERLKILKNNNNKVTKKSLKLTEEEINLILNDEGITAHQHISTGYNHSIFLDFESFLRTIRIDEEDIIYL